MRRPLIARDACLGLCLALVSLRVIAAEEPDSVRDPGLSRLSIHLEISASPNDGPDGVCEAVVPSGGEAAASWGAVGSARPAPGGGIQLESLDVRCGSGALPDPWSRALPGNSPIVPVLILEISVTPRWDPGPMDPGPVPVVNLVVTTTSRRLKEFGGEGAPVYGEAERSFRSIRLGEGEEFDWPLLAGEVPAQASGLRGAFLRIHARGSERPGAVRYGVLTFMNAAPGSEIRLDGGVAARAGSDGRALLSAVPAGLHEVVVRAVSGRDVTRYVMVVKARAVLVTPDETGDRPARPFALAGKNAAGFPEFRRARDGATMVRIPEGEFTMGNLRTEGKPMPHRVFVSAFLMDKLPVTSGQFKRFAAATGRPLPPEPYWGDHDDHPVAFVRWDEARAYCEWADARLPTEAEREKAARGVDERLFPWGEEEPTPERGVFRRQWGYEGNDRVGIRPAGASPYGLLDTGGNMWEWCEDWHDPASYQSSPRDNPMGPRTGRAHVVRGGSWDSRPTVLSASCRNWGYVGYREGDFGFRCAADPPK